MSTELKLFFLFMQTWIDGGCGPNKYGIDTGFGLCRAVLRWGKFNESNPEHRFIIKRELTALFDGESFPFNINMAHFDEESMSGKMYQNQKRLDFVKEHSSEMQIM